MDQFDREFSNLLYLHVYIRDLTSISVCVCVCNPKNDRNIYTSGIEIKYYKADSTSANCLVIYFLFIVESSNSFYS